MAEGNRRYDHQQSDGAGAGPSEIQPSLVDPHETPTDSLFNILAGEGQVESFEDIFDVLSNVELHPPCPPPLPPLPLPTNAGHGQVSNRERETQQNIINQDNSRRRRPSEAHNLMERRRRTRIQEKMNVLQQLIPNCNKTDRVSTLTDVIDYIKFLQKQVEIMPPTGIPVMPHQAPYMAGAGAGAGGQQSMQVPCFPPLVPMTPVLGMGYGMGVYGGPPAPYPTGFPLSPNFIPPFPLPSATTVGDLGAVQVVPQQQFPFQPATLTSATSMTTTRAYDVGDPSTTTTLVSATSVTTISSSRVVAETTADMIHQMSGTIQGQTTRGLGSMPIVRPSQIATPSFQGNQCPNWILDEDYEELAPKTQQP